MMRPRTIRRTVHLDPPPLDWLTDCSDGALADFLLRQHNEADLRQREAGEVLEEWVRAEALALLAAWLRGFREKARVKELAVMPAPPVRPVPLSRAAAGQD